MVIDYSPVVSSAFTLAKQDNEIALRRIMDASHANRSPLNLSYNNHGDTLKIILLGAQERLVLFEFPS